jgi:signal peptidase I
MPGRRAIGAVLRRLSTALRFSALLASSTRVLVEGESMLPALADRDRILVSRLAYRLGRPRRGDIALLRDPSRSGYECIKRIVALPGERVRLKGLSATVVSPDGDSGRPSGREWQLAESEYFVVGDNLAHSRDSRDYGPVQRSELRGPAWYRYASRSLATGLL